MSLSSPSDNLLEFACILDLLGFYLEIAPQSRTAVPRPQSQRPKRPKTKPGVKTTQKQNVKKCTGPRHEWAVVFQSGG